MKQSRWNSCVAAALAMIVGETEEYVMDWFGFSPPYSDSDASVFLAHHGIFMGLFLVFEEGEKHGLEPGRSYQVDFEIDRNPAYVIAKSERLPDKAHALYWDGHQVHDPNPKCADGRPLSEYEILYWYPLVYSENRYAWLQKRWKEEAA